MAVYIPGLHVPKSCVSCWFNVDACYCARTKQEIDRDTYHRERMSKCPMKEVDEPHGDLIERDPIIKFIQDGINREGSESFGYDGVEILTEVQFAPAVIPATEESSDT